MKPTSNKAAAVILTALIAVAMTGFGDLAIANAQRVTSTRPKANPFCDTVLPRLTTKMQERFTERTNKLNGRQTNRVIKTAEIATQRIVKMNELRTKQGAFRTTQYEKLRSLAKDDAQKQAVEKFIATVNEALNVKLLAISSAGDAYQVAVVSNYRSRINIVNGAVNTYRAVANSALANAKSDCDSGNDGATVKTQLKTDLKNGREGMKFNLKALEEIRGNNKTAAQDMRTKASDATQVFKTATAAAREELKKALGPGIPE